MIKIFKKKEQTSDNRQREDNQKRIIKSNFSLARADIQDLADAIEDARSVDYPDRKDLLNIYFEAKKDTLYQSCLNQRINKVIGSNISLMKGESENEQAKELFNSEWFAEFVKTVIVSQFEGFKLGMIQNNQTGIDEIEIFPEFHVIPERNEIRMYDTFHKGDDWNKLDYANWLIEIGNKKDLGILESLSEIIIRKRHAKAAYSEYIETYGVPPVVIKTTDATQDDYYNEMLEDWGRGMRMKLGAHDSVELINGLSQDTGDVFTSFISYCDKMIALLILGQTSTIDEKSHVGSAEVHERVLESIIDQDKNLIEHHCNRLIEKLVALGFNFLSDTKVVFDRKVHVGRDDKFSNVMDLLERGFDIDPDYIQEEFNIEIKGRIPEEAKIKEQEEVIKKVANLYKDGLK